MVLTFHQFEFLVCDAVQVYPENGGSRFLQKVSNDLGHYIASHPRR
jgi:hypothetical protein